MSGRTGFVIGKLGPTADCRAAGLTDPELPTQISCYAITAALRQALGAAVRWGHMGANPAKEACSGPPACH